MSFIRCLSNPEAMYIWHDVDETVHITHSVKPPLASKGDEFCVPTRLWYGLWRVVERNHGLYLNEGDVLKFGDLKLEEKHIYIDSGRIVKSYKMKDLFAERKPTSFRWKFSYGKHFVYMWQVTLEHIYLNVLEQLEREKTK